MRAMLERFITESLSDLAAAREQEAAYPSGGDWNDSPDLWCECDSPICELA